LVEEEGRYYMEQFVEKIFKIKNATFIWDKVFNKKVISKLQEVDAKIGTMLLDRKVGSLSSKEQFELDDLLKHKQELLAYEETEWRIKSRETRLMEGYNNMKYFHNYVNYHKVVNMIWEITDLNGRVRSYFGEIVEAGKYHFSNIFRESSSFPIDEILKDINSFLRSIN
jgi:hypothetical protein